MSKRVFVVIGHNNYTSGSSINAAVRDTFIEEAKKNNHKVDLLYIDEDNQLNYWDRFNLN